MTGGTSSCRHRGHGMELHDSTRYTISIGPTLSRSPRGVGPKRATLRRSGQDDTNRARGATRSSRHCRLAPARVSFSRPLVELEADAGRDDHVELPPPPALRLQRAHLGGGAPILPVE